MPGFVRRDVPYATAYTRSLAESRKPFRSPKNWRRHRDREYPGQSVSPQPAGGGGFRRRFQVQSRELASGYRERGPHWLAEHWVQILGPRIAQIHIKEYSRNVRDERGPKAGSQVDLLTGDNDWPTVLRALDEVGYPGWLIAEQFRIPNLTDEAWLAHVSTKMDQIISS